MIRSLILIAPTRNGFGHSETMPTLVSASCSFLVQQSNLLSCQKRKKHREDILSLVCVIPRGEKRGKYPFLSLSKNHKVFVLTCGYVLNCGFWVIKNTVLLRCFLSFKCLFQIKKKLLIVLYIVSDSFTTFLQNGMSLCF